jgi:hypothetical protein
MDETGDRDSVDDGLKGRPIDDNLSGFLAFAKIARSQAACFHAAVT